MSIIVLKDGYIAMDGRCSDNGFICDDDYVKMVRFGENSDKYFFFVGSPAWIDYFTKHYLSRKIIPKIRREIHISGIVFDEDKIYHCWIDSNEGEIIREQIQPLKGLAIGSGQDHAFTAMDMGASAFEAVKMAIKRDSCCGGRIRQWEFGIRPIPQKYVLSDLIEFEPQYKQIENCCQPVKPKKTPKSKKISERRLKREMKRKGEELRI